jgi:hypothetical protein
MISWALRGVRGSVGLLAAGTILGTALAGGSAASAQNVPAGAVVQPLPSGEGAELRRHLADLAANPRNLSSLIGAGRAAIQVGDGQAALGFFARADEIAPSDARVKAGMASAFVLLEQPQAALRFFAEAVQLGAPVAEIARDRGLAYDMSGDPRRAQQDYALVLQRGDDPETRRRLALSLAISGNRDAALQTLDPLLRRHDRASYRTRAFILALTGDANGAAQAVNAAMPGQGNAMAPFLSRLAGLNPAQKAMAVHFGHFPSDGRPVQMAQNVDTSAYPGAIAAGTGGATSPPAAAPTVRRRTALAEPLSDAPRRRPATSTATTGAPTGSRTPAIASSAPARGTPAPVRSQPVQVAAAQPQPVLDIPPAMRRDDPVQRVAEPRPQPAASAPSASTPVVSAPEPARPAFSEIAELVQSLPTEEPAAAHRPAAPATTRSAATPARTATRTPAPATARATTPATGRTTAPTTGRTGTPATGRAAASGTRSPAATRAAPRPPAHPARHWVQLGTGQRAALGFTFNRIRTSAPELLRNRNAYWASMGASNRLLIGPFATSAEARAFVNRLSRQRVNAFAWSSAAGEEVERLPAR